VLFDKHRPVIHQFVDLLHLSTSGAAIVRRSDRFGNVVKFQVGSADITQEKSAGSGIEQKINTRCIPTRIYPFQHGKIVVAVEIVVIDTKHVTHTPFFVWCQVDFLQEPARGFIEHLNTYPSIVVIDCILGCYQLQYTGIDLCFINNFVLPPAAIERSISAISSSTEPMHFTSE